MITDTRLNILIEYQYEAAFAGRDGPACRCWADFANGASGLPRPTDAKWISVTTS